MTDSGKQAEPSLYVGYEGWKGWTQMFTYPSDVGDYYAGELRGIPLVDRQLLEIGFGSGNFLAWAQDQGAEVAGTEINPASLDAARRRGIELLPIHFETAADIYANRFDVIVSLDVFEHFPINAIRERLLACFEMLQSGGILLLRFPNGQSPFGLPAQYGDPTHITPLSRAIVEQLIYDVPHEIVRYSGAHIPVARNLGTRVKRAMRRALAIAIGWILNFTFGASVPWDPVVTLVIRKS